MTESIATRSEQQLPVCFVLMPIADVPGYEPGHFARTYEHLLKPAIIKAGYLPVRADDAVKTDYIVVGIIQKIVESEMVLCDFSARNPNVMYELGVRHAFNKPVVLIRDKKTDRIFDIQGLRYTEYDESLRVDTVNKDIGKIQSAITETASATDREMNSIVRLAGIQTAAIPDRQIISPDTNLLLTAIGALDRRLQEIETFKFQEMEGHFSVEGNLATFTSGLTAGKGDDVYTSNGEDLGKIVAVNVKKQSITVKKDGAAPQEIFATSKFAKGIDSIPF